MSDHIKSADLCARCVYTLGNKCHYPDSCLYCEMNFSEEPKGCKCLMIKSNTPCPYFKEDTEK